jgi:hypothetical protein
MLSQSFILSNFIYNPANGDFLPADWIECSIYEVKRSRVCKYKVLYFAGKCYYVHRLAWIYAHGSIPDCIDHIDGNGLNNAIDNLRNVSRAENNKNSSLKVTNTSGFPGVFFSKNLSKWCVQVRKNKKTVHVGYFIHKDDAIKARKQAQQEHGYHENHGKILQSV